MATTPPKSDAPSSRAEAEAEKGNAALIANARKIQDANAAQGVEDMKAQDAYDKGVAKMQEGAAKTRRQAEQAEK